MKTTGAQRDRGGAAVARTAAPLEPVPQPSTSAAGLAGRGQRRRYRKGTVLIQEGDSGDSVYVILSGRVKVYSTDENDHEFTYSVMGPGAYFGEMSLDGGARSASVITMEPTECAVLGSAEMRAYMAENPQFAFDLLVTVIRRAREATRAARGLALGGVYSRLAAFLDNACEPMADGARVVGEVLTQQEIASRVGSSREMISRIMKDLETGGYIRIVDRRVMLLRKLPEKW